MAATLGFGDLQNQGQQDPNQQQGQQPQGGQQQSSAPSQTPGAGQQGTVAGQTGGGGAGGQGGVSSGAPGSQYKPQAYSQQTQGTGFVNLQQYLNANNPSQLQNAVVSNLGSQNQSALGGVQAAQQQFQQGLQANQANTMANQGLVQNVLNNPTAYSSATGANPQAGIPAGNAPAGTTPTSPNLAQGSQFSQLIGGQYAGPTGLVGADQLTAQGTAAAQQAANLQSAGGRTSILQGLMANPNYTQGQAALDSALLGQGNQSSLNQVANQGRQLQQMISQANTGATAQGQEAQSNAQQFGQQVQGQLTNTVQGQLANLQNQAANVQQQRTSQYNQMLSDLQSGNVTQQEASMLGLTQGENVYNVLQNPSAFLTANPTQATASNVATPQQYAQMQALQQLAGSNAGAGATSVFQQFANPSQAGTVNNIPVAQANQSALQSAITGAQTNYNAQLAPSQQALSQAQAIMNIWNQNGGQAFAAGQGSINAANVAAQLQAAGFGGNGTIGQGDVSGALGGTMMQNYQWAVNQLNKAQAASQAAQANVNAAYGTPETINIQGSPQTMSTQPVGPMLSQYLGNQTTPQQS